MFSEAFPPEEPPVAVDTSAGTSSAGAVVSSSGTATASAGAGASAGAAVGAATAGAEADVKVKNEEFLQSLSYVRHSSDPDGARFHSSDFLYHDIISVSI